MKRVLYILFLFWTFALNAQDPQLTQFYAAPLYLGPSFAGSAAGSRVGVNFRDQWTSIPGSFITGIMSYDHYFHNLSSGLGVFGLYDQAGSGRMSTTSVGLAYSYHFKLDRKWQVRPGIQFYYSQRAIKYHLMTFGDQVSIDATAPTSVEVFPEYNKVGYIDFAASVLAFSDQYWGGFTIDHIARPNESLTGSESRIPYTCKVYGGAKYGINGRLGKYDEESITIAALYKCQGKYDQLDMGAYWMKKPLVLGFWYRGIPGIKAYKPGYANNDAAMILVGYRLFDMSIAYSYDFTISRLVNSTAGSHEISIQFEFFQDQKIKRRQKRVIVPCPKF